MQQFFYRTPDSKHRIIFKIRGTTGHKLSIFNEKSRNFLYSISDIRKCIVVEQAWRFLDLVSSDSFMNVFTKKMSSNLTNAIIVLYILYSSHQLFCLCLCYSATIYINKIICRHRPLTFSLFLTFIRPSVIILCSYTNVNKFLVILQPYFFLYTRSILTDLYFCIF